jgi:GDP-D-mannose dehydratase
MITFAIYILISLDLPSSRWSGNGEQEHAIDKKSGRTVVKVDAKYFRPAEVECVFFPASKESTSLTLCPDFFWVTLLKQKGCLAGSEKFLSTAS